LVRPAGGAMNGPRSATPAPVAALDATAETPRLITGREELAAACRRWRRQPAIGVDTEFVRQRTFFPALGLIQIATGADVTLIDPLAVRDLTPLGELLGDQRVVKVFHACSEDLEVLYHRFDALPEPLFDTQLAAAFAGYGYSLGYAALVARIFGDELPKGETRTDWLARPLAPEQLRYAALDAAYLPALHRRLAAELEDRGMRAWLEEEMTELARVERFLPPPQEIYRRIKGAGRLDGRQRAALRRLAAWRERTARELDLPRGFVLRDDVLLALAEARPLDRRQLARIPGLHPRQRRRYGDQLLRELRAAGADPPLARADRPSLAGHRQAIKELQALVASTAERLDLPAELLASRKVVQELVGRVLRGARPALPRALRGWRRQAIGEALEGRCRELLPAAIERDADR